MIVMLVMLSPLLLIEVLNAQMLNKAVPFSPAKLSDVLSSLLAG